MTLIESLVSCVMQQKMTKLVTGTLQYVKKQRIGKHDRDDPVSVPFIVFRYIQHVNGVFSETHHENDVNSIQVILLLKYVINTMAIPFVVLKEIQRQE